MQSVANANGIAKCYGYGDANSYGYIDSDGNSHSHGNCHSHADQYARAQTYSKPEASPNAAAPRVGIVSSDYLTLMWELANKLASSPSDPPAVRDYSFVARATCRSEETFVARDQRPVRADVNW